MGIQHGFGFSAGAIDYFLNYGLATKPLLIIPIGVVFFVIYYLLFRFVIEKFDIATPGRLESEVAAGETEMSIMPESQQNTKSGGSKSQEYIKALGGAANIKQIEACITRLRLELNDTEQIDESALQRLGATGVLKANKNNAQVVVGTKAEMIADSIKKELK
ncbi:glucose PTS transporter subunit EIIB [Halanaerobium salsuginis]|uniref:PTS system, N-acetylglucosamine-specific IIC component n=1 Tax=Halanaerobium salsuginis TaxID=29563 RepID=A0A1I4H647_9FIRM|nr:glucose PTS transporter subunit EIIB [Halanaerobium salsuginis]SFL37769.1 PTS system, N-acetylglucosamine-specific IIC component [Halanaerobium salsuginis]